jgi:glycerol-3-phosphate acyltransferase PlsX
MIRIGLDMMGGDFAVLETAKGLLRYIEESTEPVTVFAIGDPNQLGNQFPEPVSQKIKIIPAASVIGMHEHPARAFKEKPDSSIAIGFQLLKEGSIDALISAGNTGAMLVGTHFSIKPVPGILRPAIGAVFPRLNGSTGILCDVGLNADCKPENLLQFAILSNVFAKEILQIENPKTGLLNIGEEEGKGNLLAQETYKLLKDRSDLHFIGNIEGRDVFSGKADVMVCDGFTGNIVLKMAEQLYEIAKERKLDDAFLNRCHFETYGGSPLLGVSKPVIIGHGISMANAFNNMLKLAEKMVQTNVMGKMVNSFAQE